MTYKQKFINESIVGYVKQYSDMSMELQYKK